MGNTSLRWKMMIPIIACIFVGVTTMVLFSGVAARRIVIAEIENSTMVKLRETVLLSMTQMMASGTIKTDKAEFLDHMKQTADIRICRSTSLDNDFGQGPSSEYAQTPSEREAIANGKSILTLDGDTVVGVYPYFAQGTIQGKNCLDCHHVPAGSVLGAITIKIPLKDSLARIRSYQLIFILLGLAALAAMTAFVYVLARYLFSPLEKLTKNVLEMKSGNLAVDFPHRSGDEIGTLSLSMNEMAQLYRLLIGRVSTSSSSIVSVVDNLSIESAKVSSGSERELDQLTQIATANEEMSVTSSSIASNCHTAEKRAKHANVIAQEGAFVVENTIRVMKSIADRVTVMAGAVENLGTRSDQIGVIIGTIEDIADQTNLLALNAAIEAARAGEQGLGFAVVALEVRALAERTTHATKEISMMIKAIQKETREAVKSMDEGVQEVGKGTVEAAKSGESLDRILDEIGSMAIQICQIATASEQQTATILEINKNIQNVAEVARTNKDVEKQVLAEINGLTVTAKELTGAMANFRI